MKYRTEKKRYHRAIRALSIAIRRFPGRHDYISKRWRIEREIAKIGDAIDDAHAKLHAAE